MMRTSGFGRAVYGISVAGLAVLALLHGNFAPLLEPFPVLLRWPEVWAYGSGAILLAAGVGLFFARAALASAIAIGVYEAVWVVTRARAIFLKPLNIGSWYGVSEALAPLVGVCILYVLLRRQRELSGVTVTTGARAVHAGRILFGAACVVFGAAHFAYAKYTAAMVPTWLPARMALTYFSGAAHAAAGLGLLLGIRPRLAATLEAIMLSLFGVLVWLPTFFQQPVPAWASPLQVQWSETLLTFLLAASAWIVAASLQSNPWSFAPPLPDNSAAPRK